MLVADGWERNAGKKKNFLILRRIDTTRRKDGLGGTFRHKDKHLSTILGQKEAKEGSRMGVVVWNQSAIVCPKWLHLLNELSPLMARRAGPWGDIEELSLLVVTTALTTPSEAK